MNNDIRNLSKWLNEEQETPIDRQALARVLAMAEQPAQQEPVAWEYCEEIYAKGNPELNDYIRANGIPLYTSPQAQQQQQQQPVATYHGSNDFGHEVVELEKAIPIGAKLYTSPPAQPQQEPVAQQAAGYVAVCEVLEQVGIGALSRAPSKLQIEEMCNAVRTLYTSPQAQRTWVGLTDVEIASACKKNGGAEWWWRDIEEYGRAIEAKLREKNT